MFVNEAILRRGRDDDVLFAFFHAQRTGGRAFVRWLAGMLGRSEIHHVLPAISAAGGDGFVHWPKVDGELLSGCRLWAGFSNFTPVQLGRPIVCLSVVRHPFFRTASLYRMSRDHQGHFLHDFAKDRSFEEYYRAASARRPEYFHNVNCRRIAGEPSAGAAIQSMHDYFGCVGTTERLGEMMATLREHYGWDLELPPSAPPDEVKYAEHAGSDAYEEIVSLNAADMALFSYVDRRADSS
jgi:hypothetical protein